MLFEQLRLDVIRVASRCLRRFDHWNGRNISARCPDGEHFSSRPADATHTLKPRRTSSWSTRPLARWKGRGSRSIEIHLHWKTYLARPDVGGIVHVHSPIASALAAARKPLPVILDVCAFNFRGQVEVAEYGMSGSVELAENVVKALGQRNAVLMANHGSLAVGKNVDVALDRCELLEKASHAYLLSQLVGGAVALSQETIDSLLSGVGKMRPAAAPEGTRRT